MANEKILTQAEILNEINRVSGRMKRREEIIVKVKAQTHLDYEVSELMIDNGDSEERNQMLAETARIIMPILERLQQADLSSLKNLSANLGAGQ